MRRMPELERKIYLRRTEQTWVLEDQNGNTVMVAGLIKKTQVSTPEIWMLLCEPFRENLLKNILQLRPKVAELLELHPRIVVRVDAQAPGGTRMMEALGFRPFRRETAHGREYIHCEVTR